MHDFRYRSNRLYCEGVSVDTLARKFGTPLYVYSQATVTRHFQTLTRALEPLDHLVCFAVKANSNLAVLRSLAQQGAGFDIVSEGELRRVLDAGGKASRCVFAGVGKTADEIEFALRRGIYCFNVESEAELHRINRVAGRLRKVAPVAVRVNPNVDAHTHAKITTGTYENKFGIPFEQIEDIYAGAANLGHVKLRGLQMHIGSQLTDLRPFELAVRRVAPLAARLARRHPLEFLSIGGGLGIVYDPALASGQAAWWTGSAARGILTPATYASALLPLLQPLGLRVLLEPGRFVTGNAGILVTRVEYVKRTGRKNFVIVDAAMNDLIRPAFYDAFHEIVPLRRKPGAPIRSDVVGPICESGDSFCKDRLLARVTEGDYLALLSAGAYGSVMSSNYNSRPQPAEVLVHGQRSALVRKRQPITDIWHLEQLAPWLAR
jgi:diaminopimelate decarboxylase